MCSATAAWEKMVKPGHDVERVFDPSNCARYQTAQSGDFELKMSFNTFGHMFRVTTLGE